MLEIGSGMILNIEFNARCETFHSFLVQMCFYIWTLHTQGQYDVEPHETFAIPCDSVAPGYQFRGRISMIILL